MTAGGLLLLAVIGFVVGVVGALTGIGGGVVLAPLVALYYGLPMHQAVGVSLVSVIATSTATSAHYVEQRVTDVRLGMTLELATTLGAFLAALMAHHIDRRTLALMFACFLAYSAVSMMGKAWKSRGREVEEPVTDYTVRNYPLGMAASLLAGGFSGLLGIGGGPIKVPVMYHFMNVPLR
ncbi:MAG TPA: sulfite exporter TauE/SafE family protein, partial [Candidatus Angelobacter sp.]